MIVACTLTACGKKGPPLPPLVRVPAAPADFAAERRGTEVQLQFVVPAANSDGSRPANIERVDVYRFTGPSTATDDQLVRLGTRVASLPVKSPRNPDVATESDEPAEEPDLKSDGLDQGSTTQVEDELNSAAVKPVVLPGLGRRARSAPETTDGAHAVLTGPPSTVASTVYAAVGVNQRGRRGPLTRRVAVPLVPPPPPPSGAQITYDETTVRLTWTSAAAASVQSATDADLLPSRVIGLEQPTFSYHVYEISPSATSVPTTAATPSQGGPARLTRAPASELQFEDKRIEWGTTRCYAVRTVETLSGLTLESDAAAPVCTTLTDTFAPAAPRDLRAVATEGAISLIWEPNSEKDLAGYIVLRGAADSDQLDRVTPAPIQVSAFDDKVQAGAHHIYAVQAIDTAGNVSPMSNRGDGTAR